MGRYTGYTALDPWDLNRSLGNLIKLILFNILKLLPWHLLILPPWDLKLLPWGPNPYSLGTSPFKICLLPKPLEPYPNTFCLSPPLTYKLNLPFYPFTSSDLTLQF